MKKIISIILSLVLLLTLTSCQSTFETEKIDSFSVMENAQIIGNLKGKVAAEGTFIEIVLSIVLPIVFVVSQSSSNV